MAEQIKVTEDEGILKEILVQGEGESPQNGQTVECLYTGKLLDGTIFDSTAKRNDEPFSFKIGVGQVIKGWDQGIATMKVGEKAVLTCTAPYAYGEAGSPPNIPANATLKFEVELLDFYDKKKVAADFSDEERMPKATEFKAKGNEFFKAQNWSKAKKCYEDAITWAKLEEMTPEATALVESSRLNLAQVFIKLQDYTKSIETCEKVIEQNPNCLKAFYRLSVSNEFKGELETAQENAAQALKLDPNNNDVKKQLLNVNKKIKAAKQQEKAAFGKLFNKAMYSDKPKPQKQPEVQKEDEDDEAEEGEEKEGNEKGKEEGEKQVEETQKIVEEAEKKVEEVEKIVEEKPVEQEVNVQKEEVTN